MVIETERLILRDYNLEDFDALFEILSDAETMQHYPKPYDEEMTKHWIEWNIQNYKEYGFGIWAVELKETGEFIGDCGITIQNIDGEFLPEIGYHIHKKYWRKGLGSEAARAVRDWAFENTKYDCLYSYMKYTNIGSFSTAIANGMKKVKEYPDPKNTISYAYAITREEWQKMKMDIRKMEQVDIAACADILCSVYNNELWQCRWSREVAIEYLTDFYNMQKFVGYVIEADGMICGAIFAHEKVWWNNSEVFVEEMFVQPDLQRKGYGTMLLEKVEEYIKEKGLAGMTLSTNRYAPAPKFYGKNGFVNCEHILFMCKEL
ncbi:MAG: GNAT family N-acetyltransferase [Lachnospiraceae bacterium]|nr:GNAT family N-acetyltransferase [Lachnospiraceae bacterium]